MEIIDHVCVPEIIVDTEVTFEPVELLYKSRVNADNFHGVEEEFILISVHALAELSNDDAAVVSDQVPTV